MSTNDELPTSAAIDGNTMLAVRANRKKPTKAQIIAQLIGIAHELDWAYFWKDAQRHSRAIAALEEVKTIVGWHDR